MAHSHGVTDTDVRFEIDPYTRKLKDNTPTKKTIVQYDHNSERYTFSLPRYIEGHDMTLCNVVEVIFDNIEKTTKLQNDGFDVITDLHIDPNDEEKVLCSWTVPNRSTQYIGPLEFSLRFACKDDDDNVTYEWNTILFTRIQVKSGSNNRPAIDFLKEQIQAVIEEKHLEVPVQAYILVDEEGTEIGSAVLVDEEVTLDATENDIRLNKTAVTDNGVTVGSKVIPAYHTYQGSKAIMPGESITITNLVANDNYDYTKFQAIICLFNTTLDDSVSTYIVSIEDNVYEVQSIDPIAAVTKNYDAKSIDLGITNNFDVPCIVRYFTYKEVE